MKNYVKTYKGYDVPEGATMAGFGRFRYNDGFYKEKNDSLFFYKAGGNEWKETALEEKDIDAIELPLADEFVPEVGQECEGHTTDLASAWRWLKVEPIKDIGNGEFACLVDGKFLRFVDQFRPIKTERDKFIDKCEYIAGNYGDLYDNGARFTEGGE